MTGNLAANGTLGPFTHYGHTDLWIQLSGSLGGGSVDFQVDAGAGFKTEYTFTELETKIAEIPQLAKYQFVLGDSTSPDLDVIAKSVPKGC